MLREILFFCAYFTWQGVIALKMLELQVPPSIMSGQPITLNCTFDLEGDTLYSIKWYKNNVEFYRYILSDRPPGQKYPLQGIYLDNKFPHGPSIQMYKTDLASEGTYRCEVSSEAPFFDTVRDEKELRVYDSRGEEGIQGAHQKLMKKIKVWTHPVLQKADNDCKLHYAQYVVLPKRGPTILGAKPRYSIADDLNVTCMSAPSKPPSFLQWFVNDKEVPQQHTTRMPPLRNTDGLLSSMLGLRFVVVPQHLKNGVLTLSCRAYISKAYLTTKSEIVATNKAKIAENHATLSQDGPAITGGRLRYQEGNVVNVNCTAQKCHPPAELRWYINDKEANRDYLRHYLPIRYPDGQESTLLGLRFTVQPRHFQRSEMRLKCVSTLFNVTNMRSEDMVISSRQESSGLVVVINSSGVTGSKLSQTLMWIAYFLVILVCSR